MPTYVYETIPSDPTQPLHRFELEQRMSEAPLTHDPQSGLPVRRVISGGLGFIGFADRTEQEIGPCGRSAAEGCGVGEGMNEDMCMPAPAHSCTSQCQH